MTSIRLVTVAGVDTSDGARPAPPSGLSERGCERHVKLPAERVVRGSRVRIARTVVRGQDKNRGIPVEQIVDTRAYIESLQRRVPVQLEVDVADIGRLR